MDTGVYCEYAGAYKDLFQTEILILSFLFKALLICHP